MDKMSIELLKLGVRFSPPTLVLLYKNEKDKSRQRSMPIRDLTKESDCYNLAARLKKRHEKYIGSLQTVRIEKFLDLDLELDQSSFIKVPERGVFCLKGTGGKPCCANSSKGRSLAMEFKPNSNNTICDFFKPFDLHFSRNYDVQLSFANDPC